jgi:hypothetical protein
VHPELARGPKALVRYDDWEEERFMGFRSRGSAGSLTLAPRG